LAIRSDCLWDMSSDEAAISMAPWMDISRSDG
jgi:hypothetical protein